MGGSPVLIGALVGLLAVDALDWIDTTAALLTALADGFSNVGTAAAIGANWGSASLVASLYIVRHLLIYVALAQYVFDWDARWFLSQTPDSEPESSVAPEANGPHS